MRCLVLVTMTLLLQVRLLTRLLPIVFESDDGEGGAGNEEFVENLFWGNGLPFYEPVEGQPDTVAEAWEVREGAEASYPLGLQLVHGVMAALFMGEVRADAYQLYYLPAAVSDGSLLTLTLSVLHGAADDRRGQLRAVRAQDEPLPQLRAAAGAGDGRQGQGRGQRQQGRSARAAGPDPRGR